MDSGSSPARPGSLDGRPIATPLQKGLFRIEMVERRAGVEQKAIRAVPVDEQAVDDGAAFVPAELQAGLRFAGVEMEAARRDEEYRDQERTRGHLIVLFGRFRASIRMSGPCS